MADRVRLTDTFGKPLIGADGEKVPASVAKSHLGVPHDGTLMAAVITHFKNSGAEPVRVMVGSGKAPLEITRVYAGSDGQPWVSYKVILRGPDSRNVAGEAPLSEVLAGR